MWTKTVCEGSSSSTWSWIIFIHLIQLIHPVPMSDDPGVMGLIPTLPVKRTPSNATEDKRIWASHLLGWDGAVDINDLPVISNDTVLANINNTGFIHALSKIMSIKTDIHKVETMIADQDDRARATRAHRQLGPNKRGRH
jgi:hypothetical protein